MLDIEDYERDRAERKLLMQLRINPLVAADLKSIRDYIAEDNADKAREKIDRKIILLFTE